MLETRDINAAVNDLKKRSLSSLHSGLAQLVYVAGTRDYNTGQYYHDGLAARFTQEIASKALAQCHEECFLRVVEAPIEELVRLVDEYARVNSSGQLVSTWLDIEPYRILVPLTCEPLSARLFCSNLKIALLILELRATNRLRD
jgi:hypothetical protein